MSRFNKPKGMARFVFFEFTEADRKKVLNESNFADTGGGARDLRFNYERFESVLAPMFPRVQVEERRRGRERELTPIRYGELFYSGGKHRRSVSMKFEPPTFARPAEGRIPTLYHLPPLLDLPPEDEGRVVLILFQLDNGEVEAHFATEQALRDHWHADIARPVLECLKGKIGNRRVTGFIDYLEQQEYLP